MVKAEITEDVRESYTLGKESMTLFDGLTHESVEKIKIDNKKQGVLSKTAGITLVALVVTIVVLLILAGITIMYVMGDNSVFKQASEAKEQTAVAKAKEKLEAVLLDLQTLKYTDASNYNEKEYMNQKLVNNGMNIIGENIVMVDSYQFLIDRSVPKIVNSIGKMELNDGIKIIGTVTTSTDFTKATITGTIEYAGEIAEITIKGEAITLPEKQNGKYTFTTGSSLCPMEIIENGIYVIVAKDKEGKGNVANVRVSEITENIDIHNLEELKSFRDQVNAGRTFEGKTVNLLADIDLQGSATNQWTPIGTSEKQFKGTFEGNRKNNKEFIY